MYRTKFKKKERFVCECCDFSTDRFNNYKRHCETKKHRDCLDLTNHEETLSVSDIYQDQRSQADVDLTSSDSTDYAIDSDGPSVVIILKITASLQILMKQRETIQSKCNTKFWTMTMMKKSIPGLRTTKSPSHPTGFHTNLSCIFF